MEIQTDEERVGTLIIKDFADLFGVPVRDIPRSCVDIISQNDFSFNPVDSRRRDEIILMILKNINSGGLFSAGGDEGKKIWEKRWTEQLVKFKESGCDLAELVPEFFRKGDILRLNGDFVTAGDQSFRLNFHKFVCQWVFQKYFRGVDAVYEFGCGAPFNLIELARTYPEKTLYGLDWVRPVSEIIDLVAEKYGYNIHGGLFDMFSPDFDPVRSKTSAEGGSSADHALRAGRTSNGVDITIRNNSAFFTSGALEQLGKNFRPYLDFVIAKSPDIVVDIDSFVELCDPDDLLDHLAIMFNEKRNYLNGYITALRALEKEGKIVIHEIRRVRLGTLYQDGFSYVAWGPSRTRQRHAVSPRGLVRDPRKER